MPNSNKSKPPKFKIGDKVLSHMTAKYGVILDIEKRKGAEPLATVKFVKDRCFKDYKKPITSTISTYWLTHVELEF